jgi:cystathionine beta-lyase/cystathionine gamma-synthase
MPLRHTEQNFTLDPSTTSALKRADRERLVEIMEDEDADPGSSKFFIYDRYTNPTVAQTERKLAEIFPAHGEPPIWTVLTSSGMAAIDCVLSLLCPLRERETQSSRQGSQPSVSNHVWRPAWPENKSWLLYPSELYGGTLKYIRDVLQRRHGDGCVKKFCIPPEELFSSPDLTDKFIEAINETKPAVVFFEPVTNPTLRVFNVPRVIEVAKSVSAYVVVDNTFTPLAVSPLKLGADLVVHSVTKALGGHGTITAGLVYGPLPATKELGARCPHTSPSKICPDPSPRPLDAAMRDWRKTTGCILSARDAFELAMQLETLELRIRAANSNARELAHLLADAAKTNHILSVSYPGLNPDHAEVKDTFKESTFGYGSIVTIDLGKTEEDNFVRLRRFVDALDRQGVECRLTLGDAQTTVLPIAEVFGKPRFENYPESLRISVGIEPWVQLKEAFTYALKQL